MYSVVELEGKRVLTTIQVAEAYGIEPKSLQRNFQRNKEHFQEGIHFLALTGEALKAFKEQFPNDDKFKFASVVYLWTEQGAFMLAKSISSDKSWAAYSLLTSQYYGMKQNKVETPSLPYDPERFLALEHRVKEIESQLLSATLHSGEQKRLQKAIGERVYELCSNKARRPAYFGDLYRAIKKRYHVESYRDVPQSQLQDALQFIQKWGGANL